MPRRGGTVTEIQYLEIRELPDLTPADGNPATNDYAQLTHPVALGAAGTTPQPIAIGADLRPDGIDPTRSFAFDVSIIVGRGGVLETSLTTETIRLYETLAGTPAAFTVNTTGGFDAVVINPSGDLKENTSYTIVVDGFLDRGSNTDPNALPREFEKYTTTFVTGTAPAVADRDVAFVDEVLATEGGFASVAISSDGQKLYVSTLGGRIIRWNLDPATGRTIGSSRQELADAQFDGSVIIGLVFDPTDANRLWVMSNAGGLSSATGFTGRVVTVDIAATALDPLNDPNNPNSYNADGSVTAFYNPFAPNAPLRVFAGGQRNAYDLVWHSNGFLDVPTNGSAGGANAPDDPSTPQDEGLTGIPTQNDFLYAVEKGGSYGHPNPIRGDFILNGGNPTAGNDPAEVGLYPVGTLPDPDYRGFAFDFGRNVSPNGAAEFTSDVFGNNLQGAIIVAQYSGPDNLIALTPGPDGSIVDSQILRRGDGSEISYADPFDLTVNAASQGLVSFPDTDGAGNAGFFTWGTVTERITLIPGTNVLTLTSTTNAGPNIDEITLVPVTGLTTGVTFNGDGNANRSGIGTLTFSFSTAMTVVSAASLNLFNHTTGQGIDLSAATLVNNGTTSVTWDLSGVTLPDGRYTAELPANSTTPRHATAPLVSVTGLGSAKWKRATIRRCIACGEDIIPLTRSSALTENTAGE